MRKSEAVADANGAMLRVQAKWIAGLRATLGLDEAQFARLVGVEPRAVKRWEAALMSPTGSASQVLLALNDVVKASGAKGLRKDLHEHVNYVEGLRGWLVTVLKARYA